MARIIEPARACLHVEAWPPADKILWRDALAEGDLEDDTRTGAARWRPTTTQTNREGYGRWINYLQRSGVDLQTAAAERVTPDRVRGYIAELSNQGVALQTRCNRISQLFCVMLALAPAQDWDWLKRRGNRMAAIAGEDHRQRPLTMFTGDILAKALKALKLAEANGIKPRLAPAIDYRNWLMVATMALMPLRRHNFAGLSITRHLRCIGSIWRVEISAEDAKQNKAIVMPVPAVLHRHFQYYFERVRPALLAGRVSDHFWISWRHTPMTDHSVFVAMTNFTRDVFGEAINPHRFRHISATTLVIAAPEMVELARALLTHGETQTTKDHYILGQSLAVGRQHAQLIANLRRRLDGTAENGCST